MKLVLFDIDGTLLHSRGCGSAATRLAMQEVFGTMGTVEAFWFGGKTDWQMLLETLQDLITPEEIEARLAEYDAVLKRHLEHIIPGYDVQPCPGAHELVNHCMMEGGVTGGIMTANMPGAAWVKLGAAGYRREQFAFGVFGSEAPLRTKLPALALERANGLNNHHYDPKDVVVIGDTPDDIACARAVGGRAIAVGTGRCSLQELELHGPDLLLEDLANIEAILAAIL